MEEPDHDVCTDSEMTEGTEETITDPEEGPTCRALVTVSR